MKTNKFYNFCIVTYETLPNPISQNLKSFLLENYNCNILYIYHPMLDMKESYKMSSGFHLYEKNRLSKSRNAFHWELPWPLLYVKDVFYTFFWCLKFRQRFDIYFASGNLNPLAGLILRELDVVKKVVYQSLDYYPIRFSNRFFNWLYFQIDRLCVKFCDETWNVNPFMASARYKKMSMDPKIYNRQFLIPGCIWFYKTKRLPFSKINRNKIVYRGSLLDFMGIDLVIKAIPIILKKIPDLTFEIVGIGKENYKLKTLTKSLNVSKNVIFHGFIKERHQMEKILSDAALGIATFNTDILDDKVNNSDPGKIKDYMLMGMPVITTNALFYHQIISERKCGVVIDYKVEKFAEAVIKLLRNKNTLKKYRQNAIKFIEEFDCYNIYKPNLQRTLET